MSNWSLVDIGTLAAESYIGGISSKALYKAAYSTAMSSMAGKLTVNWTENTLNKLFGANSVPSSLSSGNSASKWTPTEFDGVRAYQRNDLFDPNFVSSWRESGNTVTGTNIERMASGRSPIGIDGNSIELHHSLQTMDSPLIELTDDMHSTWTKTLHINQPPKSYPSAIDRNAQKAFNSNYWINRSKEF